MTNNGIVRRLEQLGRVIGYRRARTITIKIPTLLTPIEGSVEMRSTVVPEARTKADEMLRTAGVADEDTVIEIAHYYQAQKTDGESEPEPIPAPELISVT